MSGLRERLSRFKKPEAEKLNKRAPEPGGEWEAVGAHIETNEWGSFVMRRREYAADCFHGNYRLGDLEVWTGELSSFHSQASAVRPDKLLFFDTETTGLGVGAGNVPFMIGIGYYVNPQFIVEQLLIRNPSEERAMLAYLQEKLADYTHIVSYNGRSFDWPILKNRFVLNRLPFGDDSLLQLDFLYPSRSLWKNSLSSCRLGQVEEDRLGFTRMNDVPGSLAPTLYFQYLAERDARLLEGVFVHNEHDIVTLAALAIHFGKVLGGELSLVALDLEELYRTGLWLEKQQKHEFAEAAFEHLWNRLVYAPCLSVKAAEYLLLLAGRYKKKGLYHRSAQLWQRYLEVRSSGLTLQLEPYIELAMYYEHREKDYGHALHYAQEAEAKLRQRRALGRMDRKGAQSNTEGEADLRRRIERLQLKLERQLQPQAQSQPQPQTRSAAPKRKPVYVRESLMELM